MKRIVKKILTRLLFIVIILGIIFGLAFIVYQKTLNKSLSQLDNRIYYGISIGGIDVGGKTEEEAVLAVKTQLINSLENKIIEVNVENSKFNYNYKDFNMDYGVEKAVSEAMKYGKDFPVEEKIKLINKITSEQHNISLIVKADEETLKERENEIREKVDRKPQNAKIQVENDKIQVVNEVIGLSIDDKAFSDSINAAINDKENEVSLVNVSVNKQNPDILASDLQRVNSKISTYTTNYSSTDENITYNIEKASGLIDGQLLMPGQEFSFNETVKDGEYKNATVKVKNTDVINFAEGISQVSTTLYRASMRACLKLEERHSNKVPVSYEAPGMEAVVDLSTNDYKFKNTHNFPIYIQCSVYEKSITVNIYGDIEGLSGKNYDIQNEIIKKVDQKITYIGDADLPLGAEVIEWEGNPSYVINCYIITYENGEVVNKELISTDTYESTDKIIKKGTNPNINGTVNVPNANTQDTSDKNTQTINPNNGH